MAFTFKFANLDGALGAEDGSSEANAWSLTQALLNAAGQHWVWVKAGSGYTITGGALTVSGSGTLDNNAHIVFKAYKTTYNNTTLVSDMDSGQPYYGGALDAYKMLNGLSAYMENPNAEWGDIDCDGRAQDILYADNKDNIHFFNFRFHNTSRGTGCDILSVNNTPQGWTFGNCIFDDADHAMNDTLGQSLFIDCCFTDFVGENLYLGGGYLMGLERCVLKIASGQWGVKVSAQDALINGCLFVNGLGGISLQGVKRINITSNTFYMQTQESILVNSSASVASVHNNIAYLAAADDNFVECLASFGSLGFCDYNCVWSAEGIVATPFNLNNAPAFPNSVLIEQDPQFVDAANGDFRPRNPAVLRGGMPDPKGDATQIGAVLQKYQFANRARTLNAGRLQIFR